MELNRLPHQAELHEERGVMGSRGVGMGENKERKGQSKWKKEEDKEEKGGILETREQIGWMKER